MQDEIGYNFTNPIPSELTGLGYIPFGRSVPLRKGDTVCISTDRKTVKIRITSPLGIFFKTLFRLYYGC